MTSPDERIIRISMGAYEVLLNEHLQVVGRSSMGQLPASSDKHKQPARSDHPHQSRHHIQA